MKDKNQVCDLEDRIKELEKRLSELEDKQLQHGWRPHPCGLNDPCVIKEGGDTGVLITSDAGPYWGNHTMTDGDHTVGY